MAREYSVLMAVYAGDKPDQLDMAIDSMLKQTLPPAQFVLIEDGRLPEALESVVRAFEDSNPGVFRVHRLAENGGLGAALAIGLNMCLCEWVVRMDADDISRPDRCFKQFEYLDSHPDIDILSGVIEEFDDAPERVVTRRVLPLAHDELIKFAKSRNPFNHVAVVFRRSKALAAGGYRSYLRLEDYDLWLRMFRAGARGANLPDPLVWVRCGIDMHARRQGIKNARALIRFYTDMLKAGDINIARYIMNVLGGAALYMLPAKLRAVAYKLLRKGAG